MGRVIVTGSSRGIGKAIVERYLDEEWTVFGASTKIIPFWEDNPRYTHAVIDLKMFKNAIDQWVNSLQKFENFPEVLINNAAVFIDSPISSSDDSWLENWNKTISINLTASSYLAKKVIKIWSGLHIDGILINISSRAAQRGDTEEFAAYAASKAGMIAFVKSVARNYGKQGITAFSIAPGFVQTDMAIESIKTYGEEYLTQGLALDAIVPPSDIATLAYRIGTGELKHSTGQTFHINSGSYLF